MRAQEPRDRNRSRGSRASGEAGRPWWALVLLTLAGAVVAAALLRAFTGPVYLVPSGSMEPTLLPGDRVHVDTAAADGAGLEHGDVVVFDGAGSLAPYRSRTALDRGLEDVAAFWGVGAAQDVYVKRVLALPGDTLSCCTADGRLERNGAPLDESYLGRTVDAAAPASRSTWAFEVPEGRMVVLGDNRDVSRDSRALLGAPGGGLIPVEKVIGRVDSVAWPLDRRGDVPAGAQDGSRG
ncbi:signal peptidase I [Micrococcus porci]|uniref:signal peptidase I n=1 Tax=Micrococcus TaxID=1269 RepID=UPI001CCE140E|nr:MULTISPECIES: signal peptidase I [Micrococcus]MCG7421629.1 signal peptidase I [Micrococcus sp. ACRRV]UBH24146.1 signal peptidase I [Micrococcus porci]